jgi:hypothetical protein
MLRKTHPATKTLITLVLVFAILASFGASPAQLQTGDDDLLLFLPAFSKQPRHLLVTSAHLSFLKQKVRDNAPEWLTLKDNVDSQMGTVNFDMCSTENIALVYLLTRESKYARAALTWARETMKENVRYNLYLHFSQCMRGPALTLNYCGDALTPAERAELAKYLDTWTNELWFNNQAGGWSLNNPGNNYHYAFMEGTAFAGYALREVGHPNAQTYLGVLFDKLNKTGGVLDYLNTVQPGGDWYEGSNYGELTKLLLNSALSAIAAMDGVNYFTRSPFFPNSLIFAYYQLMPGNRYICPTADLARTSAMPVNPYDRDYIQAAVFWLPDSDARRYGQWYLENVMPSYTAWDDSQWRAYLYKDMIFKLNLPSLAQNTLPISYRDAGTRWCNWRTGWDACATCVSLSGAPIRLQDHPHHDVGSFTIWKQDWLAMDANTLSHSGLLWEPGAHNMLNVEGCTRTYVPSVPGLIRYWDVPQFAYAQVDGTNLFGQYAWPEDILLMDEWTREFLYLKPDSVVVYDRVIPKSGSTYDLRFHFPVQPNLASGLYTASYNGGGISLLPLVSGAITVQQDTDVEDGSTAWRVQQAPSSPLSGRFLNVLQVASGAPPALTAQRVTTTTNVMEGALWNNDVIMFSTSTMGAPPTFPFSYTLPGTDSRTHTLLNMSGSCDVAFTRASGQTTVTVSTGTTYRANSQGVLRFTQ